MRKSNDIKDTLNSERLKCELSNGFSNQKQIQIHLYDWTIMTEERKNTEKFFSTKEHEQIYKISTVILAVVSTRKNGVNNPVEPKRILMTVTNSAKL